MADAANIGIGAGSATCVSALLSFALQLILRSFDYGLARNKRLSGASRTWPVSGQSETLVWTTVAARFCQLFGVA